MKMYSSYDLLTRQVAKYNAGEIELPTLLANINFSNKMIL